MESFCRENERIDDLERNGYRIIQNKSRFCFGMDAVLLSGFVCEGELEKAGKSAGKEHLLHVADLGSGTGIIPLLLHGKLWAGKQPRFFGKITGLEIQEEMQEMAQRSVRLNGLEAEIEIRHGDLRQASLLLGRDFFDVVTSNPPYMKSGGGIPNPDSSKAIARHELLCSFEDVAREAAAMLKQGGRFYLVHRPQRLIELLETMHRHHLEPKRLRMVHSFADMDAQMILVEAHKGGRPCLKAERPLIIFQEKDVYTPEIRQIYGY